MLKDEFSCMEECKIYCNCKMSYKPESRTWVRPILFIFLFILFVFHSVCQYLVGIWEIEYYYAGFSLNGLAFLVYLTLIISPFRK